MRPSRAILLLIFADVSLAWPLQYFWNGILSFGQQSTPNTVSQWSFDSHEFESSQAIDGSSVSTETQDIDQHTWRDFLAHFTTSTKGVVDALTDHYIVVLKDSTEEKSLLENVRFIQDLFTSYLEKFNFAQKWIDFAGQENFSFEHYEKILQNPQLQHEIVRKLGKLTKINKRSLSQQAFNLPSHNLGGLKHIYRFKNLHKSGYHGYAGRFPKIVIDAIRSHPDVAYIEQDQTVQLYEGEPFAPWGLARLSHRESILYDDFVEYCYRKDGGEGVKVYVIDTGVNTNHSDISGRAILGMDFIGGDEPEDGNGHGSHVSGIIAGTRFGVAKKAHIVGVKVLSGAGAGKMSDVLAGMEWVASAHIYDLDHQTPGFKGSVMNLSLGGPRMKTMDEAINAIVGVGVHTSVAAGNENQDACDVSPAAADGVITVGASTIADERASFSNWGPCVDIFAPGMNIRSIWNSDRLATNMISGTSMASPHIAGLAAYILSIKDDPHSFTPELMKAEIQETATRNILQDMPEDTLNLLAFNNYRHEKQPFDSKD